jgi:DNA-binding response OmpR family regulator
MDPKPPDVIVIGAEWPERALLRAQLIEEGHDVVAVDTWPIPRLYRRTGMKPRVLLIDLHGLPTPRETLDEVRFVVAPERVLVLTALGSLTPDEVRARGFHVIERPASIGQIVNATGALLSRTRMEQDAQESPRKRGIHGLADQ